MTETLWFDSGWPPPASSVNAYAGYLFYLSPGDGRRPDPSAATLQAHLDAGRDLAPIWQQGKVDIAAGGFPMGVDHAQRANADADAKGVPSWVPIVYACDTNYWEWVAQPDGTKANVNTTFARVQDYYRGVLSVAGRRVGAYGGSYLIAGLREQLGIRWFMQAAATSWSDGVSPYAQFWQRDPNVAVVGGVVDQVVPLATYPTWRTGHMAAPMSPQELYDRLKAEGVPIKEYAGWRDRCRCHDGSHERGESPNGRAWGPNIGTTVHITAGALGGRTVEQYIRDIINGDSAVPCKAQLVVDPDGYCWLNSAGRANHQGYLSQSAHDAYAGSAWRTDVAYDDRRGQGLTGNTYCYGIENIAATSMNDKQRDTSVRICAAISRRNGWDGRDCAGHGEGSSDRSYSDPNLDMGAFRRDVMARVAAPPNYTPPPPVQEDDMPTLQELRNDLARTGQQPDGSWPLGDIVRSIVATETGKVLDVSGTAGAADQAHNGADDTQADVASLRQALLDSGVIRAAALRAAASRAAAPDSGDDYQKAQEEAQAILASARAFAERTEKQDV